MDGSSNGGVDGGNKRIGGGIASGRDRRGRSISGGSRAEYGSIDGLRNLLKLSLELVANGEKHASSNTAAMTEMSEWLSTLEQKQLVRLGFFVDFLARVIPVGSWRLQYRSEIAKCLVQYL